jgi:hypothetical protein
MGRARFELLFNVTAGTNRPNRAWPPAPASDLVSLDRADGAMAVKARPFWWCEAQNGAPVACAEERWFWEALHGGNGRQPAGSRLARLIPAAALRNLDSKQRPAKAA